MSTKEIKYEWDSKMLGNYFMIQLKANEVQTILSELDKYIENESLIQGGGLR